MWQRLNRREQVLLGILGAILVLYIYWSYVFTPLYQNFEDTRHELKMVSQRLRKGEDVANARQRWEAAVREAEENLSAVSVRFNNDLSDGAVLVEIGLEASRQGVKVTLVRPAEVVRKDHYLELPLEFTATGNYPQVLEFIKKLENLANLSEIRRMQIVSLVLAENPGASPAASNGLVQADFTLVLYGAPAPEKQLQLDAIGRWVVGRYNAFQASGRTAPYPGI